MRYIRVQLFNVSNASARFGHFVVKLWVKLVNLCYFWLTHLVQVEYIDLNLLFLILTLSVCINFLTLKYILSCTHGTIHRFIKLYSIPQYPHSILPLSRVDPKCIQWTSTFLLPLIHGVVAIQRPLTIH